MIANLVIIVFLLVMAYWWGAVQGFFSALLHLVLTIIAGTLALALWEPISMGVLMGIAPSYAWGVGLIVPFAVILFALRVISDSLVRANAQTTPAVNLAAGGLCGLFAGILSSGMAVIGLGFLPLGMSLGGYQPYTVEADGSVVPNAGSGLWVPVDRQAAAFYGYLSGGSFFGGNTLEEHQPEMAKQAALFRLRYDKNSAVAAHTNSVEVTNHYALEMPIPGIGEEIVEDLGGPTRMVGLKLVVVETTWKQMGGTYDGDSTLRVPPMQIRLISTRRRPGEVDSELHAPVGFTKLDPRSSQRRYRPFNTAGESAFGANQEERFTWVFLIPKDEQADHVLVRRLRFPLPEANNDAAALIAALGRSDRAETATASVDGQGTESGGPDGGVGTQGGKIAGAEAVDLRIDNRLPLAISKNLATGLNFDKELLVSGTALVRAAKSRIGKGSKVERLKVPNHLTCVRMKVQREQARSLLGSIYASAAQVHGIYLMDDRANPWSPVGYVWLKKDRNQEIHFDLSTPLRSMKQLPISDMRTGDNLFLYFVVQKGITITNAHFGATAQQEAKLKIPE